MAANVSAVSPCLLYTSGIDACNARHLLTLQPVGQTFFRIPVTEFFTVITYNNRFGMDTFTPVSYTHLDVYKRQHEGKEFQVMTNSPRYDYQLAINDYWKEIGGLQMLPGTNLSLIHI